MVPAAAPITGVLRMPSGWILPQFTPFAVGESPMFVFQTAAPVVSSSAITSLPVVTAKNTPFPAGPFAKYSGEAHIAPSNLAAKPASLANLATTSVVSVGWTNRPSPAAPAPAAPAPAPAVPAPAVPAPAAPAPVPAALAPAPAFMPAAALPAA